MNLLLRRDFAPLFWTQFFSAFGDNVLKNALVFVILHQMGDRGGALVTLAGGIFIAPFFVLSGLGGQYADRFDKAAVTRRLKMMEGAVALVAGAGFVAQSLPILLAVLFLYGCLAALFGPVKYGILPDLLAPSELGAGNALIEGATFLAILLGTIGGGLLAGGAVSGWPAAFAVGALALLCWATSLLMPARAPAAPTLAIDANLWRSTAGPLRALHADRPLWRAGVLVSLFWMAGAIVLSLLPVLVTAHLGMEDAVVTLFLAAFAVAIAAGAAVGARLMGPRLDLRAVPFAALAMALFALDIALSLPARVATAGLQPLHAVMAEPAFWRALVDLVGLAVAGGVFVVPTFAAVQAWSPAGQRARMVGAVNILSAAFMVAGAAITGAMQAAGVPLAALFGALAAVLAASAGWCFRVREGFAAQAPEPARTTSP